jgi:hypothetical protein
MTVDLSEKLNETPKDSNTSKDEVYDIIKETLPKAGGSYIKYSNIAPFKEGGTRRVFTADWGPGEKKVVIKVDKTPSTPHAKRHVSRGHTTESELKVAARIESPEEHNILALRDYYFSEKLKAMGYSGFITVEDYFPGETLEDTVRTNGPLGKKDFAEIFGDVLIAENYLITHEKLLNRDANPKNILVEKNGRCKAVLTDLTNAGKIAEIQDKISPTYGAKTLVDPLILSKFSGVVSHYNEASEARAIALDMYFAATGQMPFRFDEDSGEAVSLFDNKNLLDDSGKIDHEKYNESARAATKKLPKEMRRYSKMFERGLSINSKKRYQTMEELSRDFEKYSKPTLWEKFKRKLKRNVIIGLTGLTLFGATTGVGINQYIQNKNLEEQVQVEKGTYKVKSEWNSVDPKIENNLIKAKLGISKKGEIDMQYPQRGYLEANPGDSFFGTIGVDEFPRPKGEYSGLLPSIKGKIYIEGYSGKEFNVYPGDYNQDYQYQEFIGEVGYKWVDIDIPKEITPGTHNMIVELYAPLNPWNDYSSEGKKVNFEDPNKVINRFSVPLVIGKPSSKVSVKRLSFGKLGGPDYFGVNRIDSTLETINSKITYKVSIPEMDTSWTFNPKENSNQAGLYLHLPDYYKGDKIDRGTYTLQVTAKDSAGDIINTGFFPIGYKQISEKCGYWDYALPDSSWSDNLVEYRKAIYGDSTGLKGIQQDLARERQKKIDRQEYQATQDSLYKNRGY